MKVYKRMVEDMDILKVEEIEGEPDSVDTFFIPDLDNIEEIMCVGPGLAITAEEYAGDISIKEDRPKIKSLTDNFLFDHFSYLSVVPSDIKVRIKSSQVILALKDSLGK